MGEVYLFSKTANSEVNYIPILDTEFYTKEIDFDLFDAIVITSKVAITALENISPKWRSKKVLSIAKMSEELASKYGVELLGRGDGYGDSLLDIIVNNYKELRWLYPRPEVVASDFFVQAQKEGVNIKDEVVYKSTCNSECSSLTLYKEDILIFTSPFTIECFMKFYTFFEGQKVVSIGSTTSKALPSNVEIYMPEDTTVSECVTLAKRIATSF